MSVMLAHWGAKCSVEESLRIQALVGSKGQVFSNRNSRHYFRFWYWQLMTVLIQGYLLLSLSTFFNRLFVTGVNCVSCEFVYLHGQSANSCTCVLPFKDLTFV